MQNKIEVLVMNKLGHFNDTARVYLEPNSTYSPGGGRITISIPGRDFIGTHFFSHVSEQTLKQFVSQCDEHYLIKKLFDIKSRIDLTDSHELFAWVRREGWDQLKAARYQDRVSKKQLRKLYEALNGCCFDGRSHLVDFLTTHNFDQIVAEIYGDDWYIEMDLYKQNPEYQLLLNLVSCILNRLQNDCNGEAQAQTAYPEQVLMPMEPSQELYRAFYDAFNVSEGGNTAQRFKDGYRAMTEASKASLNLQSYYRLNDMGAWQDLDATHKAIYENYDHGAVVELNRITVIQSTQAPCYAHVKEQMYLYDDKTKALNAAGVKND